jgi:hypothetical protein
MNAALRLARTGKPPRDARRLLEVALRDDIVSDVGRNKTVRILAGAWIAPAPEAAEAVKWAQQNAEGDLRMWHLGVLLANYTFFANLCAEVGRGIEMSEEVDTTSLRAAMQAQWGGRDVTNVSTRSAVRTLRSFGVLTGREHNSASRRGDRLPVGLQQYPWVVDCLLSARETMELDSREVVRAPELFMFELPTAIVNGYPNLERHNEGGGRVVLRRIDRPFPSPEPTKQLRFGV